MTFNLVLVPVSHKINALIIGLAEHLVFRNKIKPYYFLKGAQSIPHISVIQFEHQQDHCSAISDNEVYDQGLHFVWQSAKTAYQELIKNSGSLAMPCCLHPMVDWHESADRFVGMTWARLLVNVHSTSKVMAFHQDLLSKLTLRGISSINPNADRYVPHFTLFNAKSSTLKFQGLLSPIPESYTELHRPIDLVPALGLANDQWELVKIIKILGCA